MTILFGKLIELWHRGRPHRQQGSLSVEVAVAAPVLITLVLGAVDFGFLMNTAASLRGATRAGAEYAKANWNNPSVTDATTSTEQHVCGFLGLTLSSGSCSPVTPTVTDSCVCAYDNTSVTCPAAGDANPCSAKADTRLLVSVAVTASQSFSPIVSWTKFAFPSTVSATTTMRTQ